MTRATTFALVGVWFATQLSAQRQPEDLAELLVQVRARHGVPALGAAVIVDGELAALGVTGVRKHGDDAKVTEQDLWHLGSCTKAMTATLLARLVERRKLRWTTTVVEGLPDLRDEIDASARAITIGDLLRHRAGLPAGPSRALWNELYRFDGSDREARTEVARELLGEPVEAPLGKRYLYSNASYMIAGAIAERRGRRDWQPLMRELLFEPLGMRSAGFGSPGREDRVEQPWGHVPGKERPVPAFGDNPPSLGPAGTVHATLADWAKFVRLHLGVEGDDPLLRPATLRTLQTPRRGEDYALGWAVTRRDWAPGPILNHSGSNLKWFCVAWLAPQAKFAVLVTCNQGQAGAACDAVAWACIQKYRK